MIETMQAAMPEIIIVLLASAMYLAGTFAPAPCRCWYWMSLVILVFAAACLAYFGSAVVPLSSVITTDGLALFGRALALLTGLGLVLLSENISTTETAPEYFASLLLVISGFMLVAGANELLILFLGLELISIPTYVLLYLARRDTAAQEAAAKYFFLSVFSSALFLYGLSLVYGAVGSTNLVAITNFARHLAPPFPATLLISLAFVVAGLGFKVAAVPFHFYAPDVYQGTTNTLAALLAWVPKAAGFLAMIRLITFSFPTLSPTTERLAWVLAVLTMTTGNVLGLMQNNLRRLFAYSSIAHAGYILIGIGVGAAGGSRYLGTTGSTSVVFYLVAYAAMTLGVFASIVYLSGSNRSIETVDDLAGLGRTHPAIAFATAVFLFSLTGIPITAGFWGKLAIFSSALASDNTRYVWVAVIGVINAAISSYYYLRIIGVMYMQDSFTPLVVRSGRAALSVVVCCCLLTLMIGIVPGPLMAWAASAGSLEHVPVQAAGKDGERLFRSNEIVAAQTSKSENASLKQPPNINH